MSSKQLDSILKNVPSATVQGELKNAMSTFNNSEASSQKVVRIVASIPQKLKQEIKNYIHNNKGETETTLVLRGLQKIGFQVDNSLLIDKRSIR
jgi:hypothetical protein